MIYVQFFFLDQSSARIYIFFSFSHTTSIILRHPIIFFDRFDPAIFSIPPSLPRDQLAGPQMVYTFKMFYLLFRYNSDIAIKSCLNLKIFSFKPFCLRPSLDIVLSPHRTQLFRFGAVKAL